MKQSKNGYKSPKIVQKTFTDLFVYSDADFETLDGTLSGNFEVAWLVSAKMYLNALATVYP